MNYMDQKKKKEKKRDMTGKDMDRVKMVNVHKDIFREINFTREEGYLSWSLHKNIIYLMILLYIYSIIK